MIGVLGFIWSLEGGGLVVWLVRRVIGILERIWGGRDWGLVLILCDRD